MEYSGCSTEQTTAAGGSASMDRMTQPATLTRPVRAAAIAFRGVTKSYGAVRAVDRIDLDVAPGEVVALLGPNGAGKSTSVAMMLGLTAPDHGTVEIAGLAPRAAVASGRIAAMLQDAGLMPGVTVAELLGMARYAYPRPLDVGTVLDLAGIADLARRRVDKLSGGQAQRVRFALAAAANPDILLLDEPTTAMDVAGRQDFWRAMRAYARRGHTVVFATHYLDEVDDNADRVVVMVAGRIVADGTPASVRARGGASAVRFSLAAEVELPDLPGSAVRRHGEQVTVRTNDPDATVRAICALPWRDISVAQASLDDTFLALTNTGGRS
jgi:ABC-2 type transport system ATP-binding protein